MVPDPSQARAREISRRRNQLAADWPNAWRAMIDQWQADGPDALWLLYSANYLLRTAGTRWVIDPVLLTNRIPEAAPVELRHLSALDFVLLTHDHGDHVDRMLLRELAAMERIRWIVPEHMLSIARNCGVPTSRLIIPQAGKSLILGPVKLTLFDGLHWEYPAGRWGRGTPSAGIDSAGCLVEWKDHRMLFPGDTRTYDASALPVSGPIDTLVAHVWLGRGAALQSPPPLLEALCRFLEQLAPRQRILLAHLWETARSPEDYWDPTHALQVKAGMEHRLPAVQILIPDFWRPIPL